MTDDFPTFVPMQKLDSSGDVYININQICSIDIGRKMITVTTSDGETAVVLREDSAVFEFLYKLAHLEFE